jgi:6,7-dimethyl-8-ribityllumazine synthase
VRPTADGDLAPPDGTHAVAAEPIGPDERVAIVASRYHAPIVQRLLDGAVAELSRAGIAPARVTVAVVPGAFELPLAAKRLAAAGGHAAVIVLGCVIRGETPHFDYVCGEAARGVTLASLETGVPIAFGVLTADTVEQAEARAGGTHGNKGAESAAAALELAGVLRAAATR